MRVHTRPLSAVALNRAQARLSHLDTVVSGHGRAVAAVGGERHADGRPLLRYGTADLIGGCQERGWGYRLRLKGNLVVFEGPEKTKTGACANEKRFSLEDVELTGKRARTHIGIIHDPGHIEPWIIALSEPPGYLRTLDYGQRWGIEPMFSDFKFRGFGVENTQIRYADRLERLILVMSLALYWAVSTGLWDAVHHPTPAEKKAQTINQRKWRGAEPPGSPAGSVASSSSCDHACHSHPFGARS